MLQNHLHIKYKSPCKGLKYDYWDIFLPLRLKCLGHFSTFRVIFLPRALVNFRSCLKPSYIFKDILHIHRELISRSPRRHVNITTDLGGTRHKEAVLWIRNKELSFKSLLTWHLARDPCPSPQFLPSDWSPLGMDLHNLRWPIYVFSTFTHHLFKHSIAVYFSRVCGRHRQSNDPSNTSFIVRNRRVFVSGLDMVKINQALP